MTTFEPGASEVFTHGLRVNPRSTAFFASKPAPIITDGFDVLVHEVIAAIAMCPWSMSYSSPSSVRTCVLLCGRLFAVMRAFGLSLGRSPDAVGGSLAGNDSAERS